MSSPPEFGLLVIGDEILSGKRTDKHFSKVVELLAARGLELAWAQYLGDDRARLTAALERVLALPRAVVFCCGGIGATPDDHTRQAAAAALGRALVPNEEAQALVRAHAERMARERGVPFDPAHPDNLQRLQMGVLPAGARLIPNPYNGIAGFSCDGPNGAVVHFVPGFPVMAWPMIEWVLDSSCNHWFGAQAQREHSVVLYGAMEAALTPLMERIEAEHPGVRVFSLPSVDHPVHGRHIELGVKGPAALVPAAWRQLHHALRGRGEKMGPEQVRDR